MLKPDKTVNTAETDALDEPVVLLPPGFLRDPGHLLAFGFGSGAMARAPGTWGTLAAIPLYYLLVWLPAWGYGLALVLAFVFGIYLCGRTARALKVHDHGGIVFDEFVGLWITLLAQPVNPYWVLLGFALFRLFDIVKPWPIRWVDARVPGGFGIMLDDVLAGLMGLVVLQLLVWGWGAW